MLPNLGALAPTSGNAEGKRPMKAARPAPAPPPVPPQPLVGLPNDVLEVMVKQAAANARNSATPVRDMCLWMKNFCSTAKMQGAKPGCEGHWYYLAMAVFGLTPVPSGVEGMASPPLPQNVAFPNWRVFFGTLCEAFNNEARLGLPQPLHDAIDPNASQRQLDTLLHALLVTEIHRILMKELPKRHTWDEREQLVLDITERVRNQWREWVLGRPSPLRTNGSIWMAVIVLLVMRGADPWQMDKYTRQDKLIILAAMGPVGSAEAMAQRVEDIDSGNKDAELAQISVDHLAVQVIGPWANLPVVGGGILQDDEVLSLAIYSKNEDLLALLLDRGTRITDNLQRAQKFLDEVLGATMSGTHVPQNTPNPPPTLSAWPFSRATTEFLIHMLGKWLASHPDPDKRLAIQRSLKARLESWRNDPWVPGWVYPLWYELLPARWRPPPPLW